MRNGRVKAALRPHAVRSASATSVPGPKLPHRGHREVAKVPNPTPPSPSDTSEKCLDLPTLRKKWLVSLRLLRRIGAGAYDHRTSAVPTEALLRVVEDSAASAEERASAAIAALCR